ncbi:MAG: helix-turn-helix transcriptional regulator [Leptospiraceae bacterium]|nr:helix-turn-helix transcriptional regulator [Leptospiraceae bacterium]MCP5513810.1 helix-turn-helix transcriptional regulator [Leptospiraceae bacterium]
MGLALVLKELKSSINKFYFSFFFISGIGSLFFQVLSENHPSFQLEESIALKIILLLTFMLQSCGSFIYWILSKSIFQKDFQHKTNHTIILSLKISISILIVIFVRRQNLFILEGEMKKFIISIYPTIFSLALLILGYTNSTIEANKNPSIRSLSKFFSFIGITLIIHLIFKITFLDTVYQKNIFAFLSILNGIITIISIFSIIENKKYFNINLKEISTNLESPELFQKFHLLFVLEKYYKQESLTIKSLSDRLDSKEYILRKFISMELGFQSFNDMLNRFRIDEACRILKRSATDSEKMISIAMDLGYSSSSAFDRAFKNYMGITPRDYLKEYKKGNEIFTMSLIENYEILLRKNIPIL